jgi:TetR/AcrR family transcriptional repressor of mexJK operon
MSQIRSSAPKQALFTAVIMEVTERAGAIVEELAGEFAVQGPPRERLTRVARHLVRGVLDPAVIQLRRIAVAEAARFPRLVGEYWDRGPGRTIDLVAHALAEMDTGGELDVPDPRQAAQYFAYAVLGPYQDQALLRPDVPIDESRLEQHIEATVTRFVRAHET